MKHLHTLLLTLAALLAIGLSLAFRLYRIDLSRQEVVGGAVDGAVRPLRLEREEMEQRLEDVQSRLDAQTLGMGVNTLVFSQPDEKIYTDIFPGLSQMEVPAVVALSDAGMPGDPGCLTREQLEELLAAGWAVCIRWDAWTSAEEYFPQMREQLAALGLEMPTVLWMEKDRYRTEMDKSLIEQGFTILLAHGEEGWQPINRKDDQTLWHLVCRPWNLNGIREQVSKAAQFGGAMVMEVDFSQGSTGYDPELFLPMCRYLSKLENFALMTPEDARAYRQTVPDSEALVAELEWAEGELQEIDTEISTIYQEN